jgi:hypothetical protein
MDRGEISKGYVYCSHCDNVVSRAPFKRHERIRYSGTPKNHQVARSSDDQVKVSIEYVHLCIIFNFIRCVVVAQMSHCCRIVALPRDHKMADSLFTFRISPWRTLCCPRRNLQQFKHQKWLRHRQVMKVSTKSVTPKRRPCRLQTADRADWVLFSHTSFRIFFWLTFFRF